MGFASGCGADESAFCKAARQVSEAKDITAGTGDLDSVIASAKTARDAAPAEVHDDFVTIVEQLEALTKAANGSGNLSAVDPNEFEAAVGRVNTYIGDHC